MTTDPTSTEERSLLRAAQAADGQAFGHDDAALRMPAQPSAHGALRIASFFREAVARDACSSRSTSADPAAHSP